MNMNKSGKVWGETANIFSKNNVSIHRIEIKSDSWCSTHKHERKYNAFFVESGHISVHVWKNDYDLIDITHLKKGESTTVKPGEFHKFECHEDSVVYEIYWTELLEDDIVRKDSGGKN
jgi:mannose-6-phosphate isomerase-like protein (cupin superfamily)